jgi:hypothetical protein
VFRFIAKSNAANQGRNKLIAALEARVAALEAPARHGVSTGPVGVAAADVELVSALQKRIHALETAEPSIVWAGIWSDSKSYDRGAAVTYGGALWLCIQPTGTRPGSPAGGTYWKLIVKSNQLARVA